MIKSSGYSDVSKSDIEYKSIGKITYLSLDCSVYWVNCLRVWQISVGIKRSGMVEILSVA